MEVTTPSDIAADRPTAPSVLCVTIKQSKTGPFRKGVDLFLGIASLSSVSHSELPCGEARGKALFLCSEVVVT